MQGSSIASSIGFLVIVIALGYLLHRIFSKKNVYLKKVKGQGCIARILYISILLLLLYIVLIVIFGAIKLISL